MLGHVNGTSLLSHKNQLSSLRCLFGFAVSVDVHESQLFYLDLTLIDSVIRKAAIKIFASHPVRVCQIICITVI